MMRATDVELLDLFSGESEGGLEAVGDGVETWPT